MPELPGRLVAAHILSLMLAITAPQLALAGTTSHNQLFSKDLCAEIIARAERRHGIPARLLRAISLAETGRLDPRTKAMIAWPWAVNAGGKGYFFPTKAKAIAAVRRLRATGARNIDVGCMQVNLMHHPKAFGTLKAAFDPARNVSYAAKFLKDLHAKTGSWIDAVAAYHSRLAHQGNPYMLRVLRIWVDRRARPLPTELTARTATRPGAIAQRRPPKPGAGVSAPKPANNPSLVRRASALSSAPMRRRWAEVVTRRKRFADWLAKRQSERKSGTGNPG
ncbi:MAG TPA: lytic transglycosylase domain-containing protein [Alphaproteobacteria bacterium]|nr:lytic transglycosylase domain-containing protein [Alphaproteobacteria bacterium]